MLRGVCTFLPYDCAVICWTFAHLEIPHIGTVVMMSALNLYLEATISAFSFLPILVLVSSLDHVFSSGERTTRSN